MHAPGREARQPELTPERDTTTAPPESDAGEEDPGASLGELPTASAIRGEQRSHDRGQPPVEKDADAGAGATAATSAASTARDPDR